MFLPSKAHCNLPHDRTSWDGIQWISGTHFPTTRTPNFDIYNFLSKLQCTKTSTEFTALRAGDGYISSAAYVLNNAIGSWNVF
jgi:hypothetical protein